MSQLELEFIKCRTITNSTVAKLKFHQRLKRIKLFKKMKLLEISVI